MTREEAIKSLKNIVEYWTYKPTEVEAAKMAIDALRPVSRDQVEKVWKGEWLYLSDFDGYTWFECSKCEHALDSKDDLQQFCPNCGAPMTDEAVEMVMERLEALYDTDD